MIRSPRKPTIFRPRSLALAALLCLAPCLTQAARPNLNPDWPCMQPLVPTVSAAMVWDGPPLDDAQDWRSDPAVAELVAAISPSGVSADDGKAAIDRFLQSHPRDHQRSVKRAFVGLLEESNQVRSRVIDDIKMLAERQRKLADIIARVTAERDQAGASADPELVQRWTFITRTYYEGEHALRYACEKPAELDQRLGIYAKTLETGLTEQAATGGHNHTNGDGGVR